ncbi:MAG: Trk system potassium transporter TrkA, partial [Proteobacteria bacterium]|nr:Trk system potassium transporter TrkA [Pseudomonadota bacterium]
MKIVIGGAGEVGFHLIENLCKEDLDIVVVDTNKEVLETLKAEFQVTTEQSNIIDSRFVNTSFMSEVDLFFAITNSDETNMIACKMASEAGAKKTICRIRHVNFEDSPRFFSLKSMGIDVVINPVSLVAQELHRLVLAPNIMDSHEFSHSKVTLVGFKIHTHCTILNKKIKEITEDLTREVFSIIMVQRQDISMLPSHEVIILENDILYFLCRSNEIQKLKKSLGYGQKRDKAKRIFIHGGGHVGLRLARHLENSNLEVRVIESDARRAYHINEKLKSSLVLNFDGTDINQLVAAGIEHADYFFAVTDNDPSNLTASLLACEKNVRRTICLIKQQEYSAILDKNSPISLGISPRLLIARYLTRFIQN